MHHRSLSGGFTCSRPSLTETTPARHRLATAKASPRDTEQRKQRAIESLHGFQSFLSRLATDAQTLANVVPRLAKQASPEAELRGLDLPGATSPEALSAAEAHAAVMQRVPGGQQPAANVLQDHGDHPALQLLLERLRSGSKPGARSDTFKLGLAVEGGGMRGCVTGGALRALHDLGARDVFDLVIGSSAGAINATYFLAGQREGVDIYHEDIANEQFIDMRRLVHWSTEQKPALDLTFLLDHVMCHVTPLDWAAVLASPVPLKVVASCLDTLEPIVLDDFTDEADLRECLRAGATVPAVAGPPVTHRGRRLVDAAVFEPVPFRAAVAEGCTHVITLCSRPLASKSGWVESAWLDIVTSVVKRAVMSPDYMREAWARDIQNIKAWGITADAMILRALQPNSHELPFLNGTHMLPVLPGPAADFSHICIDPTTLQGGIHAGEAAVLQTLGTFVAPPTSDIYGEAGLAANGIEPYVPALQN